MDFMVHVSQYQIMQFVALQGLWPRRICRALGASNKVLNVNA